MNNETIHKRHSGIPENVNNSERMLKIFGESYERHEHHIKSFIVGVCGCQSSKNHKHHSRGFAYLTQVDFGGMMVVTLWIDGFALEISEFLERLEAIVRQ